MNYRRKELRQGARGGQYKRRHGNIEAGGLLTITIPVNAVPKKTVICGKYKHLYLYHRTEGMGTLLLGTETPYQTWTVSFQKGENFRIREVRRKKYLEPELSKREGDHGEATK